MKIKYFFLSLFISFQAAADTAIIVHPDSAVGAITLREVADVFLGRVKELRDGTLLIPIDQKENPKIHKHFYKKAAKKTPAQLKAYWARLVFTGQGEPPYAVKNDEEVLELITSNPNMIAYIDAKNINPSIKTVFVIKGK